jgi:hypothetical protein
METQIPNDDEMNDIFKAFKNTVQMIPATHENHQMAIAIGTPDKHTKYLVTFEKFE